MADADNNSSNNNNATDYDSPWKEALHYYLPECIELLAPWLYDLIDWSHTPEFLNSELQAISPTSANGRRYADQLVRLKTRQQKVIWLLLHIEVQGNRIYLSTIKVFAARMFQYHIRIHDYYRQTNQHSKSGLKDRDSHQHGHGNDNGSDIALISLGILTNSQSDNTEITCSHADPLACTEVTFRFPVVHLKNWLARWDELENHAKTNPFAVVIMAQLIAQNTPKKRPRAPYQEI